MKIGKYILYLVATLIAVVVVVVFIQFYNSAKQEAVDGLYLIPENSVFIVKTNNYDTLISRANKSLIWSEFIKSQSLDSVLKSVGSAYSEFKSFLPKSEKSITTYYSFHFIAKNQFESMLTFSSKKVFDENDVVNFFKRDKKVEERDFKDEKIYSFEIENTNSKINFVYINGSIFFTTYAPLLEKLIIEKQNSVSLKTDNIDKMKKIAGKDALATIFINQKYLYNLLSSFSDDSSQEFLKQISFLANYSILDFDVENQSMELNGLSISNKEESSFLKEFDNYKPAKIKIFDYLPINTSYIHYFGSENLGEILTNKSRKEFGFENKKAIQNYEKELNINILDCFYPWIKEEIALCLLKTNEKQTAYNGLVVIRTSDEKLSSQLLSDLQKKACEYKNTEQNSFIYKKHQINYIPISNLLPNVFGELFSSITETYYTIINNHVVFANSDEVLEQYIDCMLMNKTFSSTQSFPVFYKRINPEAHMMIYMNLHDYNDIFQSFLNSKTISALSKNSFNPGNLGDLCIQLIQGEQGTYTSVSFNYTNLKNSKDAILLKIALDNDIVKGPFIVDNQLTGEKDIIVFDSKNIMYRINNLGKILWEIPVSELPLGDVKSIDAYNNGKYQIIYNSANYIYMFDVNGNKLDGYPLTLENKSTAPLTIVDYDSDKNYRILIPESDNKIHNYKINGKETEGWKNIKMKTATNIAVQYFKIGTKDLLVVSDSTGNIFIANRKGESQIRIKSEFTNNNKTLFYKVGSNLVTTDSIGNIISININGEVKKFNLKEFSKNHYFQVINIDGKYRYIYYDKENVYNYDENRKLLWMQNIEKTKETSNFIYDSSTIVFYNKNNNNFIFCNANGELTSKSEYIGSSNFVIYKQKKSKVYNMVTEKGRIINQYTLM